MTAPTPDTTATTQGAAGDVGRTLISKVPEATVLFWVLKVLTTGMGEVVSDALIEVIGWIAVGGAGVLLVVSLVWQFRGDRYRALPYWSAVAMVSVFGTMVADFPHRVLKIPYVATTIFFACCVLALLGLWYYVERTLSIHSIVNRRRETFYWGVVMATFALGTAIGDLAAQVFSGYFLPAGLFFGVLIALPGLAYRFLRLNAVAAFWMSYVVTRPLGASFADWLWVPGPWGAGFGKEPVAIASFVAFLLVLAWVVRTRNGDPATSVQRGFSPRS